ncbi:MAG: ATP-binding cassette domain-containing protein [Ardenticatenales bacterium]|nr:ATP-binding cassette domain-containing protein [Ardenticatenales bacterium]
MSVLVRANGLAKHYLPEDILAVRGISFEIQEGEIFSLLGPNGAGKTTMISMLSCLLAPTAGDATIAGHSITRDPMKVKNVIGIVPQEIALYPTLSARSNLIFWGRMYSMGGSTLKERVDQVLEQVGLTDRADARVETYSGGMKRRINLAVGLLHKPRMLFMDEPTVGIDPQSRRNILEMVKNLNRQGMTVLYTTHYMEEAQELSDRVGIIDHGELIALDTQAELTRIVGANDSLRFHLDEGADCEALVAALREVPTVIQVSAADHEISLLAPEAEKVLPAAITAANQLNCRIRSVDIQEPNLEAVFLHLTGRALRD